MRDLLKFSIQYNCLILQKIHCKRKFEIPEIRTWQYIKWLQETILAYVMIISLLH